MFPINNNLSGITVYQLPVRTWKSPRKDGMRKRLSETQPLHFLMSPPLGEEGLLLTSPGRRSLGSWKTKQGGTAHLAQSLCEPRGVHSYVLLPREFDKVRGKTWDTGATAVVIQESSRDAHSTLRRHIEEQTHKTFFSCYCIYYYM